jgi:hypothetical protein
MLMPSYKTQEEIPEGLRDHYEQKDGAWVLQGFVPKSKLDEFRDNNRNLAKEKEALQTQLLQFKDIDPTKYAEAVEKLQALENERLAEAGEWKVLKANLEQKHADEMKKAKDEAKKIQDGWNREKISNQTAMLVLKHAVPEEGNMRYIQNDILEKATIDPETNKIVFLDEKGLKMKNAAGDGDLDLEEFLTKTYIPNSKLFRRSEGAGALGGQPIPILSGNTVSVENIDGGDVSGDMITKLASGEIKAV